MPWLQFKIFADNAIANAVGDFLTEAGAQAVTFLDATEQAILEPKPGTTPLWEKNLICGLFTIDQDVMLISANLARQFFNIRYTLEIVEDELWERAWLQYYKAQCFANKLWVCPIGQKSRDPDAISIELDPGLAFGTGTHPSTALCLDWLARQSLQGKSLIDYGCGSGILAIAAAKLGAKPIWAIDQEPQALVATRNNAIQNALELQDLHILAPEQLSLIKADILIANILADTLIQLAPFFANLVRPQGYLILAGILQQQMTDVIQAYHPWFALGSLKNQEDWIRIIARRNYSDNPNFTNA